MTSQWHTSSVLVPTHDDLSVGVSEEVLIVAMGRVVAVLHYTSELPLPIASQVALLEKEREDEGRRGWMGLD